MAGTHDALPLESAPVGRYLYQVKVNRGIFSPPVVENTGEGSVG